VAVQEEAVALAGGGVAGTAGVEVGAELIDDIDDPPPQALNAVINKAQAAGGNQRRRIEDSLIGRCDCCMELSRVMRLVVFVSSHLSSPGMEKSHLTTNACAGDDQYVAVGSVYAAFASRCGRVPVERLVDI
jgi:hypothetical protein